MTRKVLGKFALKIYFFLKSLLLLLKVRNTITWQAILWRHLTIWLNKFHLREDPRSYDWNCKETNQLHISKCSKLNQRQSC